MEQKYRYTVQFENDHIIYDTDDKREIKRIDSWMEKFSSLPLYLSIRGMDVTINPQFIKTIIKCKWEESQDGKEGSAAVGSQP